jgi:copper chaperone CopZ
VLLDEPGVIDVAVSYERKRAEVRVRSERPPEASALLAAVEKSGYSAALSE